MARNFILANTEEIRFGSAIATFFNSSPTNSTILAKARISTLGEATDRSILSIGSTTESNSIYTLLKVMGTGAGADVDKLRTFIQSDSGNENVLEFSAAAFTTNLWHTVGQIKTGNLVQVVLKNVISTGGTPPTFGTWSDLNTFDIGAVASGSTTRLADNFMGGDVAEVAVWSVALTQSEIDAYDAGMSPLLIRPQSLIFYSPLYGVSANSEVDLSGQNNGVGTLINTPAIASHPPVSPFLYRKNIASFLAEVLPIIPGYTPPVNTAVNFNFSTPIPFTRLGELLNLYNVNPATLNEGEVSNKYAVNKASLDESELSNLYAVNAFKLAQGELSNKYSIAKAFLALGELSNEYSVEIGQLKLGELSNKYSVNPATLTFGELAQSYSVESFRLKLGELSNKYAVNPVLLKLAELQNLYSVNILRLKEGELQQEYSVQDAKVEAQLLASYAIRFAKQFESIYGVTVSRQLLAQAFFTLQKQFDAPYQIRTVVAKQLDSLFDITNTFFIEAQLEGIYSMARITRQLDGSYSIGPVVQKQLDAPYILASIPVAKQLDSIFDIKITNSVEKQLKGIYAILTTQIINITGQPTVTLNGEVLQIDSADVAIDEGSFVWRANIGILDIEDYVKFNINDDIILDLYGETFNLVIESKNLTRSGPAEVDMGLIAVSPAIKFDFPRADALDISFTSDIDAETAAEQALDGEDIDWQILDWIIPANRLAIKDGAPIQLVKTIVEAAGGVLESKPDGQLVARPLFPVSIPDFDTAPLDQTYSDQSDNLSVSESFAPTRRLNLFRILDVTVGKRDSIEFELDEGSVTDGDLKLFPSPFATNRVIKSSRGSEIGFQFIGIATEQKVQQVEFKEGFATLSRPIESIDSVVYESTNLGALTFTQGDTKIFSASVVNLYSLATVTYTTKFLKFRVTGVPELDVQFRAEVT